MANRKRKHFSNPSMTQEITLHSEFAQRVYRRSYKVCTRALFSIDVVLRIVGEDDQVDQVENAVLTIMQSTAGELVEEITRMEDLLEARKITGKAVYSVPLVRTVEIDSPMANQFLGLIVQFDQLLGLMDTLWLHGVLSGKQRTEGAYQWQRRLVRIARTIIDTKVRAMEAAARKGKEEDVKAAMAEYDAQDEQTEPDPDPAAPADEPDDPPDTVTVTA